MNYSSDLQDYSNFIQIQQVSFFNETTRALLNKREEEEDDFCQKGCSKPGNYKDFLDIKSKNESNSNLETPDDISFTNDSVENFQLIEEANKIKFSQVDLIHNPNGDPNN